MPTSATPSTSANSRHISSSRAVRGARPGPDGSAGAGSARTSSLPLGVSGSSSRVTSTPGTMYSGSRPRSAASAPAVSRSGAAATA